MQIQSEYYSLTLMYRSISLIIAFVFFSVFIPCFCVSEGMSFVMAESSCVVGASHEHRGNDAGCMNMNVLDHVASWRAFLSSSLPVLFVVLSVVLLAIFVSVIWYTPALRIFEFQRGVFHPPEYFDERVLLSSPIFRALFSGVLHAKVA